jgi:hypothetical protein
MTNYAGMNDSEPGATSLQNAPSKCQGELVFRALKKTKPPKLFNFRGGRFGGGVGLIVIVGTAETLDAFLESFNPLAQAFAETRQFAGSKDKQRYDKNHYQMPGL